MTIQNKIHFLKPTLEDAEKISEISNITFRETYQGKMNNTDLEQYIAEAFSISGLILELQNPLIHYRLVYYNNMLAGYSKFENGLCQKLNRKNIGELSRVYIKKEFYGSGMGEKILDEQILIAKDSALLGIWLSVWSENKRAIRFYEKHGFIKESEQIFLVGSDPQKDFIFYKTISFL